jgi:hypothetical protein
MDEQTRLSLEIAMEELAAETRHIMLNAGRSYLQQQLDDLPPMPSPVAPEQPQP